jgi:hypothetical protein
VRTGGGAYAGLVVESIAWEYPGVNMIMARGGGLTDPDAGRRDYLRRRVSELSRAHGAEWSDGVGVEMRLGVECRYRRGFVGSISLSDVRWRAASATLRKAYPIEHVVLLAFDMHGVRRRYWTRQLAAPTFREWLARQWSDIEFEVPFLGSLDGLRFGMAVGRVARGQLLRSDGDGRLRGIQGNNAPEQIVAGITVTPISAPGGLIIYREHRRGGG